MEKTSLTLREKQAVRAKSLRQLLTQRQKDDIKKAFDHFDQKGAGSIKKKENNKNNIIEPNKSRKNKSRKNKTQRTTLQNLESNKKWKIQS